MAFCVSLTIATGALLVGTYGGTKLMAQAETSEFIAQMTEKYAALAEILRGLFIVTSTPLVMGVLFLSMINQALRRCGVPRPRAGKSVPCNKPLGNDDRRLWVTATVHHMLMTTRAWKWTTVVLYVIYWGAIMSPFMSRDCSRARAYPRKR